MSMRIECYKLLLGEFDIASTKYGRLLMHINVSCRYACVVRILWSNNSKYPGLDQAELKYSTNNLRESIFCRKSVSRKRACITPV